MEPSTSAQFVMSLSSETLPLLKILLHGAKHPHLAVNGILLGKATDSAVSITDAVPLFHNSTQLAMPTEIALTQVGMQDLHAWRESVDRCHSDVASCAQIEAYAATPGSPQIVGYYQGDSRFQAADMGPLSRKMADKISDRHPNAVLLLLDNKRLAQFMAQQSSGPDACGPAEPTQAASTSTSAPFEVFTRDGKGGSWKREPQGKLLLAAGASAANELRESFSSLFQREAQRTLVDFDDHFDDLTRDWLNPGLKSLGKMELPGQVR